MTEFYIRNSGALAAENGYPVVAIYPNSKRPMGQDWNHRPLAKNECETFYNPEAGVGILCGYGRYPLACVDMDVSDEAIIREMLDLITFGKALFTRTGRAPRKAVIVRTEKPIRSFASCWFEKDGNQIRVEVLGEGKQFVAYHIHEKTHKPYVWDNFECEPIDSRIEYVPLVTEEQIRSWLDGFESIAQKHGYKPLGNESSSSDSSEDVCLKVETEKCGLTLDEAREYIQGAKLNKPNREVFLKVGMALHFEFDGSEEAKLLWDEWARDKEGYRGYESLSLVWDSFKRESTDNPLTMRWIIKECGRHQGIITRNDCSEYALQERVPVVLKGRFKRFSESSDCCFFREGHWERMPKSEGQGIVRQVITGLFKKRLNEAEGEEFKKAVKKEIASYKTHAFGFVSRVYDGIAQVPSHLVRSGDFDRDTRYFGVANGDIDLKTGQLLPPNSKRMVSLCSPVAYAPEADCPIWRRSVEEWVGPVVARYLQVLFGYVMLGQPSQHELFVILFGSGCNGKSTMTRILSRVFGQYYCPINTETYASLSKPRSTVGTARADLIALKGARMVVAQESDEGAVLNDSSVKAMTGGDPIVARQMYSSEVERIVPTWTTFLATNHIPRIKATDNGLWRRLVFIEFPRNFDKDPTFRRDPDLTEKLDRELPGVLNWLLEGLSIYRKEGLKMPDEVSFLIASERENADVFSRWFKERVDTTGGKDKFLDTVTAWVDFTSWARRGEEDICGHTKVLFGRKLKGKALGSKRVNSGNRLFGLQLKPDLEEEETENDSWE